MTRNVIGGWSLVYEMTYNIQIYMNIDYVDWDLQSERQWW